MIVYLLPVILISITIHELSHGYCSYKLGDPTAKNAGRLTLNPIKHLDILGTIMILISGFGWAKPVPINPMYYNDMKKGTTLVSLAGPLSNIFLALLFSFPMAFIGNQYAMLSFDTIFTANSLIFFRGFDFLVILFNLSRLFYIININLAVFNILPIPPLDGSKILSGILPQNKYFALMQYENIIGVIFLIVMFVFPGVIARIMSPFIWIIETAMRYISVPVLKLITGA
ncbi:MAG: site-2 protease family protein [Clostridiaceae bacterium]|nr:site-2 protease family protein [Clostridiaceae bacterium]